jgi:hypothetical protein
MALAPPIADPPLTDAGDQHSHAWTAYNQAVADSLDRLNAAMGVTDGSDAAAGQIGEWLSSVVATPAGIGNNNPTNVTSLSLTAGDWDVRGEVWYNLGAGPTGSCEAAISTTAGAMPSVPGIGSRTTQIFVHQANSGQVLPLATCRLSLSAPATVYLIALCGFSSGTTTAYGRIEARRAR